MKSIFTHLALFVCILLLLNNTASSQTTSPTDYFRSITSGNWNTASTWESSTTGSSNWIASTLAPTSAAATISIRSGHMVSINSNTVLDQLVIASGGILELATGSLAALTVNDGAGNDIIVQSGGVFKHNVSNSQLPVFIASSTMEIQSGGILEAATGNGNPSDYAVTTSALSAHVLWNDNSIFNWNNTSGPNAEVTYFPSSAAIPVFRFSTAAAIGGAAPTIINGLLEANAAVSFQNTGSKTIRNGIIGTGAVGATVPSVGQFIINGATAKLGGGMLTLPDAGLSISAGTITTLTSNKTINIVNNSGTMNIAGTLLAGDFIINGTARAQVDGTVKTTNVNGFFGGANTTFAAGFAVGTFGSLSLIDYNRSGDQTVTPLYYANISLSGSGIKKVGTGSDLSLTGTLDIAPSVTMILNGVNNLVLSSATMNINANATFDNGGESQIKGTTTVNIYGTFITRASAGFSGSSAAIPGATNTSPSIIVTIYDGSTIEYGKLGDQVVNNRSDYRNMTFSGSGIKSLPTMTPTGTVSIKDNAIVDASNKTFGDTSTNLAMSSGRFRVAGTGTKPDIAGTYNLTGGVIEFSGGTTSSKETIRYSANYQNIEISGANVGNSVSNVSIASGGSFTVKTNGSYDNNAYRIDGSTGTQTFIMEAGSTFKTGVAGGFSGSATAALYNIENITIDPKSTIIYSRTSDQTVTPLAGGYPTLLLKGGGIKTVSTGTVSIAPTADSIVIDPLVTFKVSGGAKANYNGVHTFIHSTANGTGMIGEITDGASALLNTTNITYERFIPAKRSFRFLSSPVTTSTSLKANWMEGQNNPPPAYSVNNNSSPGYGTHITGSADPNDGLDATATNNPSLFTYNSNKQVWQAVTNSSGTLVAGSAYRILVRGSRSVDLSNNAPTPSNTIIRTTGVLATGSFTVNSTTSPSIDGTIGNYSLIGNPYASSVNWDSIPKSGLSPYYYVWDPTLNTRGAYAVYGNNVTSPSFSQVNQNIQSGMSFFVRTSATNPSLIFKEVNKTSVNRSVFRSSSQTTSISIQLLVDTSSELANTADGVTAFFGPDYSNSIGDEDAIKILNLDENLSIARLGRYLSIEGRSAIIANDTIQLFMSQFRQKSYHIKFVPHHFFDNTSALFIDHYLKSETHVNLATEGSYAFSINSDSASFMPNRFMLVFKALAILPITMCHIGALQISSGIKVEWETKSETNMAKYEIEKSADGNSYQMIGSIGAKANSGYSQNYDWLDADPVSGISFYRVKMISKLGDANYSNTVRVVNNLAAKSITIFPNPITGNTFNITLTDLKKGAYSVSIYSVEGQRVFLSQINYQGMTETFKLSLAKAISKGKYTIEVSNKNKSLVKNIVLE